MTAVITAPETAKPSLFKPSLFKPSSFKPSSFKPSSFKPSRATLARIETVLTLTLVAQMIGLAVRYAL